MALSRAVLLCVVVSCSSLLSPAASPATGSLPPPHMEVCAATAGAALIRGSCRTSGGWGLREGGVVGAAGLGPRLSLRGGGDGKGQGKKGGRLKKGGKKAKYGGRRPRKDGIDSEVSSLLDSESDGSSTSSEPVAKRVKPSAASSSPLALGSTSGGGKAEGKEEKGRRRVQGAGVSLMPEGGEGAGRGEGQKGGRLREDTFDWEGYGIEADPKMMQLNPMMDEMGELAAAGPAKSAHAKRGGKNAAKRGVVEAKKQSEGGMRARIERVRVEEEAERTEIRKKEAEDLGIEVEDMEPTKLYNKKETKREKREKLQREARAKKGGVTSLDVADGDAIEDRVGTTPPEGNRFYLPPGLAEKVTTSVDPEGVIAEAMRNPDKELAKLRKKVKKIEKEDAADAKALRKRGRGVIELSRIPFGFYEDEQFQYFSQFGKVTRLRLSMSKKTGGYRGYGWIEFADAKIAAEVAEEHHGMLLKGTLLKCRLLPPDKVHEDLFKNCDKKFYKVDWKAQDMKIQSKPRSPLQMRKLVTKRVIKLHGRWKKLKNSNDPKRREAAPFVKEDYDRAVVELSALRNGNWTLKLAPPESPRRFIINEAGSSLSLKSNNTNSSSPYASPRPPFLPKRKKAPKSRTKPSPRARAKRKADALALSTSGGNSVNLAGSAAPKAKGPHTLRGTAAPAPAPPMAPATMASRMVGVSHETGSTAARAKKGSIQPGDVSMARSAAPSSPRTAAKPGLDRVTGLGRVTAYPTATASPSKQHTGPAPSKTSMAGAATSRAFEDSPRPAPSTPPRAGKRYGQEDPGAIRDAEKRLDAKGLSRRLAGPLNALASLAPRIKKRPPATPVRGEQGAKKEGGERVRTGRVAKKSKGDVLTPRKKRKEEARGGAETGRETPGTAEAGPSEAGPSPRRTPTAEAGEKRKGEGKKREGGKGEGKKGGGDDRVRTGRVTKKSKGKGLLTPRKERPGGSGGVGGKMGGTPVRTSERRDE